MFPFRKPDEIVTVNGEVYLYRWFLTPKHPRFCIMLHKFMRGDTERVLHDHPWDSVSILLSGYMRERVATGVQVISSCWPIYRPAKYAHSIIYVEPGTTTLFIRGAKFREWGFLCESGWVHWKKFVGVDGCG